MTIRQALEAIAIGLVVSTPFLVEIVRELIK